ncbi:FAD-binding oxidoreductase, partial [Chryseobacterium sp. CH1]|uniref:FAD-binding oxidoreductase n=1 Tax=Chryseobacterium sp. CH1 TaxID=713551 RepID=UPI001E543A46
VAVEIPEELKDKFRFKQGQYLNFRMMINGNEERRSYSICNAPSEKGNTLEVLVKLLEGGKVAVEIPEELKDKFRFKQGQYLNFRMMINGNEER